MSALLAALVLATAPGPSPAFGLDSTWDKGKPEVVTYTTASSQGRSYSSWLAIRKGLTALKNVSSLEMIYTADVPGGARSVAARLDRATLSPIDLEASWGDSSGHHSAHVRVKGSRMAARADGDSVLILPSNERVFAYDVLPSMLRAYDLSMPTKFSVQMLPTQLSRDLPSATLIPAEVEFYGYAGRPSDTSRGGLSVEVRYAGRTDRMSFHPGPGHVLLVWERADGTTLMYKRSERRIVEEK